MTRYLIRRTGESVLLMLGVLILVFFMVRLTGDPVSLMIPKEAPPEQREAFAQALGLDRPLPVQFVDYMGGVFQGDLGDSLRQRRPNLAIINERLPATLQLATAALAFAMLVAIPLGLAGGMRPGSSLDALARGVGLAGQTIPNFWLGMILIVFFAVELGWFPAFGRDAPISVVLPAVSLGFAGMGQLVRLTRSAVLEVRKSDYIRTALSKGVPSRLVSFKHVLPNVAIPIVSVIGIQFTYLLGGSVYIEVVFAWPGLGTLLEGAIRDSDFPLVQAITIFISLFAISIHLLTDVAYGLLDPRLRLS
ncbi:MAG: ABC transporter permease [Trueperaceae bacterium]|nr:ABC transporter permease [Trueperaceae bacterium]